jgi:hypothetical protein
MQCIEKYWTADTGGIFQDCLLLLVTSFVSEKLSDTVTGLVWPRGWVEVYLYSSMTAALEGG